MGYLITGLVLCLVYYIVLIVAVIFLVKEWYQSFITNEEGPLTFGTFAKKYFIKYNLPSTTSKYDRFWTSGDVWFSIIMLYFVFIGAGVIFIWPVMILIAPGVYFFNNKRMEEKRKEYKDEKI